MKEETKLYRNNQNHRESRMRTNGIVGCGKNSVASVCVEDIELPIVFVIIELHFKGFQSVINTYQRN